MASMASTPARNTGTHPHLGSAENNIRRQQVRPPAATHFRTQLPGWFSLLCLCVLALAGSEATSWAQTFQSIPALSFTQTYEGANPLSQVITIASTGADFDFYMTVVDGTGGSWLTIRPSTINAATTPDTFTVTAAPTSGLSAGTYTAEISLKPSGSSTSVVIPVSLTIEPGSASYFDELPGAYTFSLATGGKAPPSEALPIRNAGPGSLKWNASTKTADGGSWLALSSTSGTAPSTPSVSINPANLPHGGQLAGTFTGQLLLKTGSDAVTIPVTVTVGDSVFRQINPLNFTKTLNSPSNALSQVITVASTKDPVEFYVTVVDGTGGSWLTATPKTINAATTPTTLTVTAAPDQGLPAGTYTAEVIIRSSDGAHAQVIPVTLTVDDSKTATYFDELPGELTFSMQTDGTAPPAETVQIRNEGSGSLNWTASTSTADGGNWLTLSATSGAAPYLLSVSINPANLPSQLAGTYTGQVLFKTGSDAVTIPVTVTVGDSVFRQINPLNFTKTLNSPSNALSQVVTVASTKDPIDFYVTVVDGTGGSWLTATPKTINAATTPTTFTVAAAPDQGLPAGNYTAEVIIRSSDGTQAQVVPVTLTVDDSTTATYFDELPGELTFSMQTAGTAPPAELVQIRNAGLGSLNWTASTSTADGGSWITLSAANGTAPYLLSLSINPANLPHGGQLAGTFTGQLLLKTGSDAVTIPVTVTVGDSVFRQINPLNFTKTLNSPSNALSQVITVASTKDPVEFYVTVVDGTGGSWLTATPKTINAATTPTTLTVTAAPDQGLPAGTYTAEVIIRSSDGTQAQVVPVTLTVDDSKTATYFDELPGAFTFFAQANSSAIPSQPLVIRNAGKGTLNWVASVGTADGGGWLNLSSTLGTSPSNRTVSINRAKLPNQGQVAATFTGQILLQSVGGIVTIPVTVTVGDPVFKPQAPLSFTEISQGANPPSQSITVASTSTDLSFYVTVANGTGGSWLTATPKTINAATTPTTFTVTAAPAADLDAGTYMAEIIIRSTGGDQAQVIPITLTINSSTPTATPTFNPPGGTYSTSQHVAITTTTPDAAIYYTTNGSTPNTSSTPYNGPVTVSSTETLKAVAVAPGFPLSAVASATYNLGQAAATPAATSTVTITEATSGVTVYYTTNGSTPTSSSTKYTGPIPLTASTVLKFIAIGSGYNPSQVRTVATTIQ